MRAYGTGIESERFAALWRLNTHVYSDNEERRLIRDINITITPKHLMGGALDTGRFFDQPTSVPPTENVSRHQIATDLSMVDDVELFATDADPRTAAQIIASQLISSTAPEDALQRVAETEE